MERIEETMKRKKIDKVKRNKEMLMMQLALIASSRGIPAKELEDKVREIKKKIGVKD